MFRNLGLHHPPQKVAVLKIRKDVGTLNVIGKYGGKNGQTHQFL